MKSKMQKLQSMSINVGADPSKAIKQISEPVYKLLDAKIDHFDQELKDNQMERIRKQKRLAELKETIFNEQYNQIQLEREIEEQKVEIV